MWVRFRVAPKQRAAAALGSFGMDLHCLSLPFLLARNKQKILGFSSLLSLVIFILFFIFFSTAAF